MPASRERATWLALEPARCLACAGIAYWRDRHPDLDIPRRDEVRVLIGRLAAHNTHVPVRKAAAA